MRKPWEIDKTEIEYIAVKGDEFSQSLDELAQMVYFYLCQLDEHQILASPTLTPGNWKSEDANAA
jgi:hypothetical protein